MKNFKGSNYIKFLNSFLLNELESNLVFKRKTFT